MNHYYSSKLFGILLLIILPLFELFAQIPAGYYYQAQDKFGSELKTSLSQTSFPISLLSYGSGGVGYTWEGFSKTDVKEDGSVYDMYSNITRQFNGIGGVDGMHIEHSFPKSWWGAHENQAYKDLFHLYPSDGTTNQTKNNLPLGEVATPANFDNGLSKVGRNTFGSIYFGNSFEPADEFKGDFARSYLYISTIYESFYQLWNSPMLDNNTYPTWKPWAIDLLVKWHEQDPVSEKEINRNEIVYGIQGNRNPFIDYPELVNHIWGDKKDEAYPFPVETQPFLIEPRVGTSFDLGIIIKNNTKTKEINLTGVNIKGDILLSLKENKVFTLSQSIISAEDALNSASFSISFNSEEPGVAYDTIIIEGENLITQQIPVKATASKYTLVIEPTDATPVGATLEWIEDPIIDEYFVNVYQGDSHAGDLFISSYVEGSSYNKAIGIYNGKGFDIDLSDYTLRLQSNGIGSFKNEYQLSGTIKDGEVYLIVHGDCKTEELINQANAVTVDVMNFNGNDAIALYNNGIQIDVVGFADDGGIQKWGEDITLKRKQSVTHPTKHYNEKEWIVYTKDYFENIRSHQIEFNDNKKMIVENLSVGKSTSYYIDNLSPEQLYTYYVGVRMGELNGICINTAQIHTTPLETPVTMEPSDITTSSFTANWEETPYADGYYLDLYSLKGTGETTELNNFDNVNTSGKPLPQGWTGTASGNYTTEASSGKSPNSISLKNTNEFIQTKTYSEPITELNFMYRFPTNNAGNTLTVEALYGDEWRDLDILKCINTSKTIKNYKFDVNEKVKAFRFTYTKSGGNLAIDDVDITYGATEATPIKQNMPVSQNSVDITGLESSTKYYYSVKATLGNYVSKESDPIYVQTQNVTSIDNVVNNKTISWRSTKDGILVSGLQIGETISIYSITGTSLFKAEVHSTEMIIPIFVNGVYIINQSGYDSVKAVIVR